MLLLYINARTKTLKNVSRKRLSFIYWQYTKVLRTLNIQPLVDITNILIVLCKNALLTQLFQDK